MCDVSSCTDNSQDVAEQKLSLNNWGEWLASERHTVAVCIVLVICVTLYTDQSSATVTKLSVVSKHGVPSEILSDHGQAFMSGLMEEVEVLLGFHKVNTKAHHPQTDGLAECYNRTLSLYYNGINHTPIKSSTGYSITGVIYGKASFTSCM